MNKTTINIQARAASVAGQGPTLPVAARQAPSAAKAKLAKAATPFDAREFGKTFSHGTMMVNGVRLHYVSGGKKGGEVVVLLHGWPETWYEWRHIMPALAERYSVIAPDLRGLGDSGKPASGYDTRTVADDIYKLVRGLGHERILLVGHDWGAPVAYSYAAAHPEAVRRLVVLDSAPPGVGEPITATTEGKPLWHPAFNASPNLPEQLIAGRERQYYTWFFREYAHNKSAVTEADITEYLRCYKSPGGLKAGLAYYRAGGQDAKQNQEYAKKKLTMPVLALGGDRCLGDGPLRVMRAVATDVRGGSIPDCGHWIPSERPDYLTAQLLAFFAP
jgi:pimeloyl-ACP methyl ester carboxylesterase